MMDEHGVPKAFALSYLCPFRCGKPHEDGFVDPAECLRHIQREHGKRWQQSKLAVRRWPHGVEAYNDTAGNPFDVGPIR